MNFQERLKKKRLTLGPTQSELAEKVDVSLLTIQNYESGFRKATNIDIVRKLAEVLETDVDELLETGEKLESEAYAKGAGILRWILMNLSRSDRSFMGGKLRENAMDGEMRALNDAYWIAKENNKKYALKNKRKKRDWEIILKFSSL